MGNRRTIVVATDSTSTHVVFKILDGERFINEKVVGELRFANDGHVFLNGDEFQVDVRVFNFFMDWLFGANVPRESGYNEYLFDCTNLKQNRFSIYVPTLLPQEAPPPVKKMPFRLELIPDPDSRSESDSATDNPGEER